MPNSPESFRDLGSAVQGLRGEMHDLNKNFELAKKQAASAETAAEDATIAVAKAQVLTRWLIGISAAMLLAVGALTGLYLNQRDQAKELHAAVKSIEDNAVIACKNANQRGLGTKAPWLVFLGISKAANPDPTPAELQGYRNFTRYIEELYAPRNCHNLDVRYKAPKPPDLSGFLKRKR